ncbi:MAG: hypothetical protein LBJ48_04950 [Coriobacteriales bacterium]|jgi:hypothetical protein|nr:hypothetical protein [Coriobacteriales bacterium]
MKKATVQALSFVSGLTLAVVVVGVTISKSPSLRGEVENQIRTVLKTTRTLVDAYKNLASKSKIAVNLIKNEPGEATATEEAAAAHQNTQTNSQWDAVEADTGATKPL